MKILLINPNLRRQPPIYPPLGLLYIAAILKKESHIVNLLDANLENLSINSLKRRIEVKKPDIVGITMNTLQVKAAYLTAEIAKRATNRKVTVVVGGPHVTALPEQTLKESNAIDIGVLGEGEITITELIRALSNNGELDNIPGLAYRENAEVVITKNRQFIRDLDTIPFPAYELASLPKYFNNQRERYSPSMYIMTSRGCPFKCVFCSNPVWGHTLRFRSPRNVVDEVELLHKKYGVREIYFLDDTFNLISDRVVEICDELMARGLHKKIKWRAQLRANKQFVSRDLLEEMKKAGCWSVTFGVESGNQEVLNLIKKNLTLDDVRRAFHLVKEVGMKSGAFFMIGNIGENWNTIHDSIKLVKELKPDAFTFSITTPYPGSELYAMLSEKGSFKEISFEHFDEMTPIVGTEHLSPQDLIKAKVLVYRYLQPHLVSTYVVKQLLEARSLNELKFIIRRAAFIFNSYIQASLRKVLSRVKK